MDVRLIIPFAGLLLAPFAGAGGVQPGGRQPARAQTTEQAAPNGMEGTVEVSFRIDATGKVQILNIAATSPQLADYVIKKLNRIQLQKGDPQTGQVIKYRFVFKKQA